MPNSPPATASTRPFAAFEWMIALRYLRAKRQDGYVSVISGFSLVGIALGVATLIIVMSVMGGFRKEFLASILGFNGHVTVEAAAGPLPNFDRIAGKLKAVPGVTRAAPIVDGQVMASQNGVNTGIYVRGMRPEDLGSLSDVARTLTPGALKAFGSEDARVCEDAAGLPDPAHQSFVENTHGECVQPAEGPVLPPGELGFSVDEVVGAEA